MSKDSQWCVRRFRHSDFVTPSDFVIRHSDLRIAVCSIKRPVRGRVRAAGGGSVHGKPSPEFPAPRSSREDSPFQPGVQSVEAIVLSDHRPVISQFVLEVISGSPFLRDVLTRPDRESVRGLFVAQPSSDNVLAEIKREAAHFLFSRKTQLITWQLAGGKHKQYPFRSQRRSGAKRD